VGINQALSGYSKEWVSPDISHSALEAFDLPQVSGDILDGEANLYHQDLDNPLEIEAVSTPLAGPVAKFFVSIKMIGGSMDYGHIVFQTTMKLLPEATGSGPKLYDWDHGTLRLAGVLPGGSTPPNGSKSASALNEFDPETVSPDGNRILFSTAEEPHPQLYVRVNHASTDWISESEGSTPVAEPENVQYQATSPDLEKVVFSTDSRLNDEDPGGAGTAIYLYTDSPDPAGEEDNLTFIARAGSEPSVLGMSHDASRGFFYASDSGERKISRWDPDGVHVAASGAAAPLEYLSTHTTSRKTAMVSADGRRLAFVSRNPDLAGSDLGHNEFFGGEPFLSLFIYDTESDSVKCASCPPTGAAVVGPPIAAVAPNNQQGVYLRPESADNPYGIHFLAPRFLTEDGSKAFFSTATALVPEDVNGQIDTYEYDVAQGRAHLLSSGNSDSSSWFANASADGRDAFFITTESLSGWDINPGKDLYDAKVDGGFPEPPTPPPSCQGDACQPAPAVLNDPTPASAAFSGAGNQQGRKPSRAKRRRCAKQKTRHVRKCGAGKAAAHKRHRAQDDRRAAK
jgi:hypothetical protein